MNVTQDGPWEDQVSIVGSETATGSGGSRRLLLARAAGGFALAASGLLLPEWLVEEAAAADHPVRRVQRRKTKQRGKHRHRLQHRRKRQQRVQRNQDGASGALLPGNHFYVVNNTRSALTLRYWRGSIGWIARPDTTLSSGGRTEFVTDDTHAGIEIDPGAADGEHRVFVWTENAIPVREGPFGIIEYGGRMGAFGYEGGRVALRQRIAKPGQFVEATIGRRRYRIHRIGDSPLQDYRNFNISFVDV